MAKYDHDNVVSVADLIEHIGNDLEVENWESYGSIDDAWTAPVDSYLRQMSVQLLEDTEGNLAVKTFYDELPSDDTTPVTLLSAACDFTTLHDWRIYAYNHGFWLFDADQTTTIDDGFLGAGVPRTPFVTTHGYWDKLASWALGCRVFNAATVRIFTPGDLDPAVAGEQSLALHLDGYAGFGSCVSPVVDDGTRAVAYGYYSGSSNHNVVMRGLPVSQYVGASASYESVCWRWGGDDLLAIWPDSADIPDLGDTITMDDGDVYKIPNHRSFRPSASQDVRFPILALRTSEGA